MQTEIHSSVPKKPRVYSRNQHSLRTRDIDQDAARIISRLRANGHRAYVVGGGVRDLLIGKKPKDFDISTDATPRIIKSLFRNSRIIGRRFKLVHIFFADGKNIEVSTFRDLIDEADTTEDESAGPVKDDNVYGTEATDALRRDLTINGLFFDISDERIIDYVGGMDDLQRGIIRVIGDPIVRFREDPARMIRVVRHAARSGFEIEKSCWEAILSSRQLLSNCAEARLFDEVKKDLTSAHILGVISLLSETRLLELIFPELLEDNAALLTADSGLCQALERIDSLVSQGVHLSPTIPLAVLAIFLCARSKHLSIIINEFENPQHFDELLPSAFTQIVVPRKERERISAIVRSWLKIQHSDERSLKPAQLQRMALLEELLKFSSVLISHPKDQFIVDQLEKALESRRSGPKENKRRNERKERGRSTDRQRRPHR